MNSPRTVFFSSVSQSEFVVTDRGTEKGSAVASEKDPNFGIEQDFKFISESSFNSSEKIELNIQKGFQK